MTLSKPSNFDTLASKNLPKVPE